MWVLFCKVVWVKKEVEEEGFKQDSKNKLQNPFNQVMSLFVRMQD